MRRQTTGVARRAPVVLMTAGRYKIKGKRPAHPIGFGSDDSGRKEGKKKGRKEHMANMMA